MITGSIVAIVSPMHADGSLDLPALRRLVDFHVLRFDLVLVPLIPIGSWLGHWMHFRVSESAFNRVIMVLTLVAGIQLLLNANLIHLLLERVFP